MQDYLSVELSWSTWEERISTFFRWVPESCNLATLYHEYGVACLLLGLRFSNSFSGPGPSFPDVP